MVDDNFEINPEKVHDIDGKHDDKRELINQINTWVALAQEGDVPAMERLLSTFESLIKSTAKKYYDNNRHLITWDEILRFCESSFVELTIQSYTIGGQAYYNVYVKRMLNFRTLYYIEQIIRHRSRNVILTDDQPSIDAYLPNHQNDDIDKIVEYEARKDVLKRCMGRMYALFSGRDCAIFNDYFFNGEDSYQKLSIKYGLSEPRISGIINTIKTDLRENIKDF